MHFTEWMKEDGYYESFASLRQGLNPILRVRAVLNSDGNYEPIVRDHGSPGRMVASGTPRKDLELAKAEAVNKVVLFIQDCCNDY